MDFFSDPSWIGYVMSRFSTWRHLQPYLIYNADVFQVFQEINKSLGVPLEIFILVFVKNVRH